MRSYIISATLPLSKFPASTDRPVLQLVPIPNQRVLSQPTDVYRGFSRLDPPVPLPFPPSPELRRLRVRLDSLSGVAGRSNQVSTSP